MKLNPSFVTALVGARAGFSALLMALLLAVCPVLASELSSPGITEAFLDVTVSSSVPGIIGLEKFKEGNFVKEGAVIIELDKKLEELEVARRKLVADNRKMDLDATRVLFNSTTGVSKEELDKKEFEYKVAAVEHDMAAEQLRKREIAAPVSGTITDFYLDPGEACQPYQPLARIVDTRQCYFVSNIEAKAASHLKVDQTVRVEIENGASPVSLEGKIIFISPVVDPASGLLKVKALFDNSANKVRPGLAGRMLLKS